MRKLLISLFLLIFPTAGLVLGGAALLWHDTSPILIESIESKTIHGGPVFNEISRQVLTGGEVVWNMKQSHHGVKADPEKWEHLRIRLHSSSGKTWANFDQLENHQPAPLRVACFMCHPNGPRAIRPNYASRSAPLSLKNKLRIQMWNLSIKVAGRVLEDPSELVKDRTLRLGHNPFRYRGPFENQPIPTKLCQRCHFDGPGGRGTLTRQHFMAIRHLVSTGAMPPLIFHLDREDRKELSQFIGGGI
ncbi:MAG: cytochrome c [Bdellovibrionales bacterium]